MAVGTFQAQVALDSATDPDDTTIIAAPGALEQIHLLWLLIAIKTPQTSAILSIEDGVGGTAFVEIDASTTGTYYLPFENAEGHGKPLELTKGGLLNAQIAGATGVVGVVTAGYRVRGG